jgi:hypothetical protein
MLTVVWSYSPFDQLNFMLNQLFIMHADLIRVSFTGEFLPNLDLRKYDFNLYKGFFSWKILAQTCQFLKKKISNHQTSMISSSM